MRPELRRSIFLACVGLLGGFALVVTLYGASTLFKHGFGSSAIRGLSEPAAVSPADTEPRPGEGAPAVPGKLRTERGETDPAGGTVSDGGPTTSQNRTAASESGREPQVPTFDIIRVEPTGEAVIAGRAASNTAVELLRDGQPIARALVDPSGQFAIVPPALPAGNSEITLRSTGADGQARTSRESVVVVVAPGRDTKPLIALTAPDTPTVVLSRPDPVATAQALVGASKSRQPTPGTPTSNSPASKSLASKAPNSKSPASDPSTPETRQAEAGRPDPAHPDATPGTGPVKIVSVEAEEGGKLYVTSQAPPGATVRLYLNDTLVAPGSVGADGRVAFTIGRGIRPGDYKIRVDQVDPVSGKVKTRSEVAFTFPAAPVTGPAAKPAVGPVAVAKGPAPMKIQAQPNPGAVPPADSPTGDGRTGSVAAGVAPPARSAGPALAGAAPQTPGLAGIDPAVPTGQIAGPAPAGVTAPRTVFVPEVNTARITRGDSLWQISRRIYGKGTRYTVIFDANQPQIRNPDLIYPGQIFVLPTDGTAAVPQAEKRG